ncbi:MAG: helix-turn-helix transcriptional regulator [Fulvivirga sp.]|uniref:helix-turn-helix domain-containing protein n=1 Tax=Fulvivirga sp. TaxID=1931237 RepID=UPI0032EEA496
MTAHELLVILRGTCIIQCLTVGIIFLFRRNPTHDGIKYLAWYLLIGAINFAIPLILKENINFAVSLSGLTAVLFSPLLFFFLTSYLDFYNPSRYFKISLISIPFIAVLILSSLNYSDLEGLSYIGLGIDCFNTLLLVYILYIFFKADATAQREDTWISKKHKWIRFLLIYSIALNISYLISLYIISSGKSYGIIIANVHFVLILVFITGLIYTAIVSPELVNNVQNIKSRLSGLKDLKYNYSDLTKEEAKHIISKLDAVMSSKELFKDPELTLEKVSYSVGKDAKDISQSINQYLNMNFKEYVNDWRIKTAAILLRDKENEDLRISEIMYEVGFNSKSSFNTLFKKHTNYTPKEYRLTNHNTTT